MAFQISTRQPQRATSEVKRSEEILAKNVHEAKWKYTVSYILCVAQIFAAIRFVDAYGTKNPSQRSLPLWGRENWKPVEILGREINSEAVGSLTQANVYGDHSTLLVWKKWTKIVWNWPTKINLTKTLFILLPRNLYWFLLN